MTTWAAAIVAAVSLLAFAAPQQRTPDIHYTPTRQDIAQAMLALAAVGPGDVVFDLGSGDGRLPIIAAQKYGARGVGIEIDPKLVAVARRNAREGGVSDRVTFVEGDLFTADISSATVVTLYLSTSVMRELEPKLRDELPPGSRIVSHQFTFPVWPPEQTRQLDTARIFFWRVPAR